VRPQNRYKDGPKVTTRRKWAAVPGVVLVAALATAVSAYSGASSPQGRQPDQPIDFPHPTHVKTLGMNCVYCHFAANKSPDPGMPATGTCLGCHNLAAVGAKRPKIGNEPARDRPEIKKLLDTYSVGGSNAARLPIPWVRIHQVPEYVRFPHMRHVNAGVTCQTCHGQVQNMNQVYQAASLNMGWCVRCHVNGYNEGEGLRAAGYEPTQAQLDAPRRKARYDCAICHY
jgi:hypothetical protein